MKFITTYNEKTNKLNVYPVTKDMNICLGINESGVAVLFANKNSEAAVKLNIRKVDFFKSLHGTDLGTQLEQSLLFLVHQEVDLFLNSNHRVLDTERCKANWNSFINDCLNEVYRIMSATKHAEKAHLRRRHQKKNKRNADLN